MLLFCVVNGKDNNDKNENEKDEKDDGNLVGSVGSSCSRERFILRQVEGQVTG